MQIDILGTLKDLALTSGIAQFINNPQALIMVAVACLLLYLAIVKKFEPLLLLPIAFGMLCTNLLGAEMYHEELFAGGHANWSLFGGAVLVNSNDMVNLAALTINKGGAILNEIGNVIGTVVTDVTGGVGFNELGQVIAATSPPPRSG